MCIEGQGWSLHKTIRILTRVLYTSDHHLVILAWTVDELTCGQARDRRTNTSADRRKQRQYPQVKIWPRVKAPLIHVDQKIRILPTSSGHHVFDTVMIYKFPILMINVHTLKYYCNLLIGQYKHYLILKRPFHSLQFNLFSIKKKGRREEISTNEHLSYYCFTLVENSKQKKKLHFSWWRGIFG